MENRITYTVHCKGGGKTNPLQSWTGPELVNGSSEAENVFLLLCDSDLSFGSTIKVTDYQLSPYTASVKVQQLSEDNEN
jgi:hypothetical protein